MTKTFTSKDSGNQYQMTISDTSSQAQACSCKGFHYTGHCKHFTAFTRAIRFAALRQQYDCRQNGDEVTHRINFEMSLGY